MSRSISLRCAVAPLTAAATTAQAADFATTYRGRTGSGTHIPGATAGQHCVIALRMNNDGSDALSQAWDKRLVRAVRRLHDADDRVLAAAAAE